MIYATKSRLRGQNIYYKKDIIKRWNARPRTFGLAKYPIPRFNLRVGTQKARLGTLKRRSETQDSRPWRWNLKPVTIISIIPGNTIKRGYVDVISAVNSSLGGHKIFYQKDISKRWDLRPGTFGLAKDPIPKFILRVGTQKARLGVLKPRSEIQDPRPWSETWGPNLFQRWNLKPVAIISISSKQSFLKLIYWFFPRRAIHYYDFKICSLKCLLYFQATYSTSVAFPQWKNDIY